MILFDFYPRDVTRFVLSLTTAYGILAWFSLTSVHAQEGLPSAERSSVESAARAQVLETDKKIVAARENLAAVDRASQPQEWAQIRYTLAMALVDRALMSEQTSLRLELFSEALEMLQAAQQVYTIDSDSRNWAQCQYDQGVVHSYMIPLLDTDQATERFQQSVAAYRDLMEGVSAEDAGDTYDRTLYNLAATLWNGRRRVTSDELPALLEEAVQFAEQSLQLRKREEVPLQWARTHSLIANIRADQANLAIRDEQADVLKKSIAASQSALEIFTFDEHAQQWINVQRNLAQCLTALAGMATNEQQGQTIEQAIAETERLLKVIDPVSYFDLWSNMQFNLATNLYLKATLNSGEDRLRMIHQSLVALQTLYQVNPGVRRGALLGLIKRDLGDTLFNLANATKSIDWKQRLLLEAVDAYRGAADGYKLTENRVELVSTYQRLGNGLSTLANVTENREKREWLRSEEADAWRESIAIAKSVSLPEQVALSQLSLGQTLFFQGVASDFAIHAYQLDQAIENLRSAIEAMPQQPYAEKRKIGYRILGHVLMAKADRSTGELEIELLNESLQAYRHVLEAQPENTQILATVVDLLDRLGDRYMQTMQNRDAADLLNGQVGIEKAIDTYREALAQLDRETNSTRWGQIQAKLLTLELKVAEIDADSKTPEFWRQKEAEFQEVLQRITNEDSPQLWIQMQLNLGWILHQQAGLANGADKNDLLERVIQHTRNGIEALRELDPQEAESQSQWLVKVEAELAGGKKEED